MVQRRNVYASTWLVCRHPAPLPMAVRKRPWGKCRPRFERMVGDSEKAVFPRWRTISRHRDSDERQDVGGRIGCAMGVSRSRSPGLAPHRLAESCTCLASPSGSLPLAYLSLILFKTMWYSRISVFSREPDMSISSSVNVPLAKLWNGLPLALTSGSSGS